jgi:hypothetical protein
MHTGDKIGGRECRCMVCSQQRWERAKEHARVHERDNYNAIQQEVDESKLARDEAERRLRVAESSMYDLAMAHYQMIAQAEKP